MFTRLHIRNFKAWRDTGNIRLAPLTVFFGNNSAGKTSLLQFLLMLKQTSESPDRRRVLHPGDRNTPVELGTFRDLVFQHDVKNEVEFEIAWNLPQTLWIRDPVSRDTFSGSGVEFQAKVASDERSVQHVDSMSYRLLGGAAAVQIGMEPTGADRFKKYSLVSSPNYRLIRNQGRAWPLPEPVRFYGFPDEVAAYYQNTRFASDLTLEFEQQLKRVQYLGPLRTYPERTYIWSGEIPDHVGWRGERAIEALLAASDRSLSAGYKQRSKKFPELVASWLQRMELLHSFEAKPIAKFRKEYEVLVRSRGSRLEVNLPDVGFGISQVLPVVVECFYAQPNSTIIMEQPELHLHPRVQSHVADLFIEAIQAREDGKDRSVQVIIESHSEHFLRRIQRRVAEGFIGPNQVALYFCETSPEGSILRQLEVDQDGNIANWPDDFFGDEMDDMVARLDAAAVRANGGR